MSPSKYLANVQIEVVKRMLYIQFGSLQKNIAQQVDFFNRLYFSHVFGGGCGRQPESILKRIMI